jgi:hypothetical protein
MGHVCSTGYANALRAIGQDLEMRDIKTLDLTIMGTQYVVKCGYQTPPSPMPVTLYYSPEDVERLDQEAREKRRDTASPGDFLTLSHILRAIGGYVEKKNARLLRVSNNDSAGNDSLFRVEYETAEGDHVVDDRSGSAIYEICVHMYKQRGKLPDHYSKYARWRR